MAPDSRQDRQAFHGTASPGDAGAALDRFVTAELRGRFTLSLGEALPECLARLIACFPAQ